jgi:hypothetical protein
MKIWVAVLIILNITTIREKKTPLNVRTALRKTIFVRLSQFEA